MSSDRGAKCENPEPSNPALPAVFLNKTLFFHFVLELEGREFKPFVGTINPLLLQLCLGAEQFQSGPLLYRETMQRALTVQLKTIIQPEEFRDVPECDDRLRRVVSYIYDELHTDLSLSKMADIAAMSPTNLSRCFKREMGVSPLQVVISQRLEKSALLLRSTKKTVAEIARQVGYNDLGRFGQHFKRKFKMAPSDYRKT